MRLRQGRPAYTLLEVLLATAIGALLMVGLYKALELTLSHAQAGRDKVNQATLARSLFTRISADILPNLGPAKPSQPGSSSAQGAAGGGGVGAATTDPSTSQSAGSSASGASSVPGLGGPLTFNLGVQGDSERLVLYVSRLPTELNALLSGDAAPTVSDLRRITYWLSAHGLSRQEIKVATSDDALGVPTDLPDDEIFVIAEELQSVAFQYFDGSAWQESWDGSQPPSSGGSNPQGPPVLIAVTVTLKIPGTSDESGDARTKSYRHVIPVPTANGATQSSSQSSSGGTSP